MVFDTRNILLLEQSCIFQESINYDHSGTQLHHYDHKFCLPINLDSLAY